MSDSLQWLGARRRRRRTALVALVCLPCAAVFTASAAATSAADTLPLALTVGLPGFVALAWLVYRELRLHREVSWRKELQARTQAQHLKPLGITSMLDVAIRHGGGIVGVLCCEHVGTARYWREEESFFASALALHSQRRALAEQVRARTHELANANAALANEVMARKQAMERAEYLFNFDMLTGLPNLHQFLDRLRRVITRARLSGERLALVGVGLDHFHAVKTRLGGAISDQMLLQTSQRMQSILAPDALLGRIGGDEFATIISLDDNDPERNSADLPPSLILGSGASHQIVSTCPQAVMRRWKSACPAEPSESQGLADSRLQ